MKVQVNVRGLTDAKYNLKYKRTFKASEKMAELVTKWGNLLVKKIKSNVGKLRISDTGRLRESITGGIYITKKGLVHFSINIDTTQHTTADPRAMNYWKLVEGEKKIGKVNTTQLKKVGDPTNRQKAWYNRMRANAGRKRVPYSDIQVIFFRRKTTNYKSTPFVAPAVAEIRPRFWQALLAYMREMSKK